MLSMRSARSLCQHMSQSELTNVDTLKTLVAGNMEYTSMQFIKHNSLVISDEPPKNKWITISM
jgi:hypothetical protein